jgi:hypothetical protein
VRRNLDSDKMPCSRQTGCAARVHRKLLCLRVLACCSACVDPLTTMPGGDIDVVVSGWRRTRQHDGVTREHEPAETPTQRDARLDQCCHELGSVITEGVLPPLHKGPPPSTYANAQDSALVLLTLLARTLPLPKGTACPPSRRVGTRELRAQSVDLSP